MSYKSDFSSDSGWTGIDTNIKLTRSQGKSFMNFLKQNNVETIIRYYASSRRAKTISKEEAQLICNEGFKIVPVYQDVHRSATDYGITKGKQEAQNALGFAEYIEQPQGTTIFFACDADFSKKDYDRYIKPYFESVKKTLNGKYRMGAYGSGLILEDLLESELIEVPWISMSRAFRGTEEFFYSKKWALRQVPPPLKYGAVYHYDKNVPNWSWDKIGAFSYNQPQDCNILCEVGEFIETTYETIRDKLRK